MREEAPEKRLTWHVNRRDGTVYTPSEARSSLAAEIESRVRRSTHGRIRDLRVEEVQGHVVVRGNVPSHHARQLALHGALELLSGDRVTAQITVG